MLAFISLLADINSRVFNFSQFLMPKCGILNWLWRRNELHVPSCTLWLVHIHIILEYKFISFMPFFYDLTEPERYAQK